MCAHEEYSEATTIRTGMKQQKRNTNNYNHNTYHKVTGVYPISCFEALYGLMLNILSRVITFDCALLKRLGKFDMDLCC